MGKGKQDLTELKCGDCCKYDNLGWGQYFCDETGLPIGADQPACISILPKSPEIRELFNT